MNYKKVELNHKINIDYIDNVLVYEYQELLSCTERKSTSFLGDSSGNVK